VVEGRPDGRDDGGTDGGIVLVVTGSVGVGAVVAIGEGVPASTLTVVVTY